MSIKRTSQQVASSSSPTSPVDVDSNRSERTKHARVDLGQSGPRPPQSTSRPASLDSPPPPPSKPSKPLPAAAIPPPSEPPNLATNSVIVSAQTMSTQPPLSLPTIETLTTSSGFHLSSTIAPALIATYVGSLRNDLTLHNAVYTYTTLSYASTSEVSSSSVMGKKRPQPPPDLYTCILDMPQNCPVRSTVSTPPGHRSKALAKQSASFNMLIALLGAKEVDDDFSPTPTAPTPRAKPRAPTKQSASSSSSTPANGAQLAATHGVIGAVSGTIVAGGSLSPQALRPRHLDNPSEQIKLEAHKSLPPKKIGSTGSIGLADYAYLSRSSFWSTDRDEKTNSNRTEWYPTVLKLVFGPPHEDRGESCRSLVLLSRQPLPFFKTSPTYQVDVSFSGVEAHFALSQTTLKQPLSVPMLTALFTWNQTLFRALMNRPLQSTIDATGLLVLPLVSGYAAEFTSGTLRDIDIDWSAFMKDLSSTSSPLNLDDHKALLGQLSDGMLTGPAEFSRRWVANKVRFDLTPLSPHPDHPERTFEQVIFSHEQNEFRYGETTSLDYLDQPIVEGEHVVGPKSGGYVGATVTQKLLNRLVVPELYQLHVIAASVFRTATAIPSLLTALDDLLLAAELNTRFFNGELDPDLALEAITCPATKAIPGQRHYERLEILGDTLLKFVISVDIFTQSEPASNNGSSVGLAGQVASTQAAASEGMMTHNRHLIVSNRALQQFFIQSGMLPYIRSQVKRAKDFIPPGWEMENGQTNGKEVKVFLGDKTIADVSESLIAASYLSTGKSIQGALNAMHVIRIPTQLRRWEDIKDRLPRRSEKRNKNTEPLTVLGYTFKDAKEGRKALSLSTDSAAQSRFQRLEFVGDAILDYLALKNLWLDHPELGPAELTRMKHSRVANNAFAAFMVHSGIVWQITDLDEQQTAGRADFANALNKAKRIADEEFERGEGEAEYWSHVPVKKWIGDAFEAIFAQIFIDSGFDLSIIEKIYENEYKRFVEPYASGPEERDKHPKSMFLETMSKRGCKVWHISKRALAEGGPYASDIFIHNEKVGSEEASAPTLATRRACEAVNAKFRNGNLLQTLCTCPQPIRKK